MRRIWESIVRTTGARARFKAAHMDAGAFQAWEGGQTGNACVCRQSGAAGPPLVRTPDGPEAHWPAVRAMRVHSHGAPGLEPLARRRGFRRWRSSCATPRRSLNTSRAGAAFAVGFTPVGVNPDKPGNDGPRHTVCRSKSCAAAHRVPLHAKRAGLCRYENSMNSSIAPSSDSKKPTR